MTYPMIHLLLHTSAPTPTHGQTDVCENIAFPQLLFADGKNDKFPVNILTLVRKEWILLYYGTV